MSRRPGWVDPRTAIPKRVKIAVFARTDGQCQAEGCDRVGKEYDHIQPVALGGDNSVENVQLLCRQCHADKTAADVKAIAKADRMAGRSGQKACRDRAKAKGKHRPIQSRGFQTGRNGPFKQTLPSKNNPGGIVRRKERV